MEVRGGEGGWAAGGFSEVRPMTWLGSNRITEKVSAGMLLGLYHVGV